LTGSWPVTGQKPASSRRASLFEQPADGSAGYLHDYFSRTTAWRRIIHCRFQGGHGSVTMIPAPGMVHEFFGPKLILSRSVWRQLKRAIKKLPVKLFDSSVQSPAKPRGWRVFTGAPVIELKIVFSP